MSNQKLNGDNMKQTTTTKRSAFDTTTRHNSVSSFNVSTAADIGLKSLVAATCGVVLYKQLKSDS